MRVAHGDVADGVDAGLGGSHVFVGFDEAALDFDFGLLDADVFGARGAADCDQHLVGFQLLLLAIHGEGHGDAVFGALDGFDLGVYEAVDPALAVHAGQFLGDVLVLDGHVARQHLEDGDVGAERLVNAGELDPDGPGADHDERLGNVVKAENFDVGEDAVVGREAGQDTCDGACRENDVLGADGGLAVLALDFDGVDAILGRAGELAVAGDHRDFVLLHQELQTLGVLVDDALLALLDGAPVQRDGAVMFSMPRASPSFTWS